MALDSVPIRLGSDTNTLAGASGLSGATPYPWRRAGTLAERGPEDEFCARARPGGGGTRPETRNWVTAR